MAVAYAYIKKIIKSKKIVKYIELRTQTS